MMTAAFIALGIFACYGVLEVRKNSKLLKKHNRLLKDRRLMLEHLKEMEDQP